MERHNSNFWKGGDIVNTKETIEKIASKTNTTQKMTKKFLDAFIDTVKEAMRDGDKVVLREFGAFDAIHMNSRRGVNPQTKEYIEIPAKMKPRFRPSDKLKDELNR